MPAHVEKHIGRATRDMLGGLPFACDRREFLGGVVATMYAFFAEQAPECIAGLTDGPVLGWQLWHRTFSMPGSLAPVRRTLYIHSGPAAIGELGMLSQHATGDQMVTLLSAAKVAGYDQLMAHEAYPVGSLPRLGNSAALLARLAVLESNWSSATLPTPDNIRFLPVAAAQSVPNQLAA